ncbi:MAG TPA: HAMP domain-containing sensor histidine kinase, partial [Chloroflexota bacterium]|nr:HAMP domain-containing sensor histidine kinase [Chloroflexota bacterium]
VRVRDEFLSVAAHELKTPLTSLRGIAQLALRRYQREEVPDPRRTRESLQIIEQQSGKLARLVSQLLDVSRIEAGRLTIEPELTDIVSLAKSAVAMVRTTITHHTIEVKGPVEEQIWALVDPLRIEQVLTNLIDNAIKFSPAGGSITVEVRQPADGAVVLSVQDRGVGIPEASRKGLFERFYQAHPFRTPGADPTMAGLGLGLYISRQIVDLHGGHIEAEFPREGGTRIVVTLPNDVSDRAPSGDVGARAERPPP